MKLETYLLPDFWAPALINDDYSGISEDDGFVMNAWLTKIFPRGAHCVDCGDSPEFTAWHDARGFVLPCDCVEFTFDVGSE